MDVYATFIYNVWKNIFFKLYFSVFESEIGTVGGLVNCDRHFFSW